jgi:exodeoxyribonuclease VII large subunit
MNQQIQLKQQHLLRLSQNLHHLNPQAVLTRGYAFVQNQSGAIVNSSLQLQRGDAVTLTFGTGSADATINKTNLL